MVLGQDRFCSIITHRKFQIITSASPILRRKMEHLSFTVNPDTSGEGGVEWKGNEPSIGGIFILQSLYPFCCLGVGFIFSFSEGNGK